MLDARYSVFAVLNVAHDEEEDTEDMEEAEGNKKSCLLFFGLFFQITYIPEKYFAVPQGSLQLKCILFRMFLNMFITTLPPKHNHYSKLALLPVRVSGMAGFRFSLFKIILIFHLELLLA